MNERRHNVYHRILRDSANLAGSGLTYLDVMRLHMSAAFQELEENLMQQHDAAQRIEDEENEHT
jgi:hypothetical protein